MSAPLGRPANKARAAARGAGMTFYYGASCRFDHAGLRYVTTGACAHCAAGKAPGYRAPGDIIRADRRALASLALG